PPQPPPPPEQQQQQQQTGYQATGPNYYQSVQAAPSQQQSGAGSTMGVLTSANPSVSKPAGGSSGGGSGGDAFSNLWSHASSGIKKTGTPTSGPSMGQLAKEKSSASLWGAPVAGAAAPKPAAQSAGPTTTSGSNGLDDLLG